ncbi:MAG: hypothetical protein ABI771_05330 [Betaproteobacteria bacterium]
MASIERHTLAGLLLLGFAAPSAALACSSCGCSLNSDWSSQGYSSEPGLRMDLRFDYFNQDQLRSGTGNVDRGSIALPTDREIQQQTVNRNYNLALDYTAGKDWGISVLVPYFDRFHTSIIDGDTDSSESKTSSLGDVRVLARYQGFSPSRNFGIQFGLKLPTGSIDANFRAGPQVDTPLDRGLQPGTGTTDLLIGVYQFGALSRDWDYFGQALVQQPLNSRDDFRPGTGLNVNAGVRYVAFESIIPHLQVNARIEKRESGANADVDNSGATLVYLSPGATVPITHALQIYGFFQVPIYQRVNGYQLEPRYTMSAGVQYAF